MILDRKVDLHINYNLKSGVFFDILLGHQEITKILDFRIK